MNTQHTQKNCTEQTIPVLFAGNQKVFDGMVIASLSMLKHHSGALHIYLLTMDLQDINPAFRPISEEQRAYLEAIYLASNPQSRVTLLDVGEFYRQTLLHAPNQDNQYTPYTFLRLFAERLEQLPDKVIYLDTDTVLFDDIALLYEQELGDAEYAAVRDRYGCCFFGINYINAGVLLLNLPRIRKTQLFRRALDACAKKKIFLSDQTTINRLAKKKKILPRRFNEQKSLRKDTVIRHFSMTIRFLPIFRTQNIKPWNIEQLHNVLHVTELDDILSDYLQRKPNFPA